MMRDNRGMSRKASPVILTSEENNALQTVAVSRIAPHRQVQRARLVLAAAAGRTNQAISEEIGLGWRSVGMWRQRFIRERLAGLEDRPRPGKPRQYSDADRLRVIETACTQKPAAETHWSIRTLAQATGVGRDTVHQILHQANLKPHRLGTFSRSTDPDFTAKVIDVVGLYLHPPEHTVVLCVDEKTQVQALDRTQPLLPLRPGQIERHTHDYKRNGTVQLYAALEMQAGQVISRIEGRHRSKEFINFMNQLLRAYPSGELHIILDNVSSHDSREVKDWHRQPGNRRVVFHFIPTYSSWLNLIEVLFNLLQAKVLRRGVFPSKQTLVAAIMAYLQKFNEEGRSFHWKKSPEAIITSVNNLTRH
jgi:transposase